MQWNLVAFGIYLLNKIEINTNQNDNHRLKSIRMRCLLHLFIGISCFIALLLASLRCIDVKNWANAKSPHHFGHLLEFYSAAVSMSTVDSSALNRCSVIFMKWPMCASNEMNRSGKQTMSFCCTFICGKAFYGHGWIWRRQKNKRHLTIAIAMCGCYAKWTLNDR